MATTVTPQLLTKSEAAAVLRVSVRKVERAVASRQLKAVKWGRHCRIPAAALDQFIAGLPSR